MPIVIVCIVLIAGASAYYAYYQIPRSGPMHVQYMLGPRAYRTEEELHNGKSFICPWCRLPTTFSVGYRPSSWSPSHVFCEKCQKEILILANQASFKAPFTDCFRYAGSDPRFWIIYRDYLKKEITDQRASLLVNQLCSERFTKQMLYVPTDQRVKSVKSISNTTDGWLCGVCYKASHECICREDYQRDVRSGKYPKALDKYFSQLRKLDLDFSVFTYYSLADWQNLTGITHDINTGRCTAEFAEPYIKEYIRLIEKNAEGCIDYYKKLANKSNQSPASVHNKKLNIGKQQEPARRRSGNDLMQEYMH